MTHDEISRVQHYLRRTLSNDRIAVSMPERPNAPVEVLVGDEFIGTLYRDDDDGETSYSLTVTILEEDLPAPGPA